MARINWSTWLAAASSLVALGASQSGCTNVDCGTGTIDKNGECRPADENTNNGSCGPGTKLGNTGMCEPVSVVQCDPGTTTAEEDPTTHVITCVGTGTTGCNASGISCPTPSTGKMTLCGQFLDAETSAPIAATNPTGKACDPANPTPDGPCSLVIRAYNAIDFASDPSTATEL
ncbi:MAG TPA: hypothetical protein VL463_25710, partial [Kofleriaceae bacterium]|nr:hypothetical protein [Kofleriaceae bacterium]